MDRLERIFASVRAIDKENGDKAHRFYIVSMNDKATPLKVEDAYDPEEFPRQFSACAGELLIINNLDDSGQWVGQLVDKDGFSAYLKEHPLQKQEQAPQPQVPEKKGDTLEKKVEPVKTKPEIKLSPGKTLGEKKEEVKPKPDSLLKKTTDQQQGPGYQKPEQETPKTGPGQPGAQTKVPLQQPGQGKGGSYVKKEDTPLQITNGSGTDNKKEGSAQTGEETLEEKVVIPGSDGGGSQKASPDESSAPSDYKLNTTSLAEYAREAIRREGSNAPFYMIESSRLNPTKADEVTAKPLFMIDLKGRRVSDNVRFMKDIGGKVYDLLPPNSGVVQQKMKEYVEAHSKKKEESKDTSKNITGTAPDKAPGKI